MHAVTYIEQILFPDPQTARPAAFCAHCGGELYSPSLMCLRCRRRKP